MVMESESKQGYSWGEVEVCMSSVLYVSSGYIMQCMYHPNAKDAQQSTWSAFKM